MTVDLGHVARELGLPLEQVQRTVELLDEGNTVPFITRFRKDQTGALDDEKIRQIQVRVKRLRMLAERKQTILKSIQSQARLTDELRDEILHAQSTKRLEDLYLPYKPKKQTLATMARNRGLEPLAQEILRADPAALDLDKRAADFISDDRQLKSVADVLLGVGHLLAEKFSENAELRGRLRKVVQKTGQLACSPLDSSGADPPRPAPVAADAGEASATADIVGDAGSTVTGAPSSDAATAQVGFSGATDEGIPSPEYAPRYEVGGGDVTEENDEEDATADDEVDFEEAATEETGGEEDEEAIAPSEELSDTAAEAVTAEQSPGTRQPGAAEEPSVVEPLATEPPGSAADAASPLDVTPLADQAEGAAVATGREGGAGSEAGSPAAIAAPAESARSRSISRAQARLLAKEKERKRRRKRLEAAFKDYFHFREAISRIPPHRVLAINRGERASILRVRFELDVNEVTQEAEQLLVPADHPHADFLRGCARDALTRLILPSLEREVRRELAERAEDHAVEVFIHNLRKLLLQPPVRGRRVLAIDPGFRSGCKVAVLDEFGQVLATDVFYLVGKEDRRARGREKLLQLLTRHEVQVVAIGNGTACRDTEQLVAEVMSQELQGRDIAFVIVNEAGASVYSTSPAGREELPQHDAVHRSAISIGRRLLDPLSELVKINPANIGVGMYQHDVKAKHLRESLDGVVESCVNYVGVDVNTASPALLRYVSGLNQLTARRLYEYRQQQGPFRAREQFRQVPGFGEATFVQAAGFLKILDGDNPLDATFIHPESYAVANRVLERLGVPVWEVAPPPPAPAPTAALSAAVAAATAEVEPVAEAVPAADSSESVAGSPVAEPSPAVASPEGSPQRRTFLDDPALSERVRQVDVAQLAQELGVGAHLLSDILSAIARPNRDPRDDFPPPLFRRGIMKLEDLQPGMELHGTVLNVVDFGAFVDIGLTDSGLVHISRLADRFVRDPHDVVSVGDVLRVWVVEVDKQRRRVSLTAIAPGTSRPAPQRQKPPQPQRHERHERPPRRTRDQAQQQGRRPVPGGDRTPPRRSSKPKFVPPLTQAMEEGTEAMHSFAQLMQLYAKRQSKQEGSDPAPGAEPADK